MSDKPKFKYWSDGSILVEVNSSECFLRHSALPRMINWLNLFKEDILSKKHIASCDVMEEVTYTSLNGILAIYTDRDMIQMLPEQLQEFITWLNVHRDMLRIHEVW